MSNGWEKEWTWDDNAESHTNMQHTSSAYVFPYRWYYFLPGGEVHYIIQKSRNFGVIIDSNYFGPRRYKTKLESLAKTSVQKFADKEIFQYQEAKSWLTLGYDQSDPMPNEITIIRPNGGGYMMRFHPVTKRWIQKIHVDENGEIEYKARMVVNKQQVFQSVHTNYIEKEYQNSLGDHFVKLWDEDKKQNYWKKL
jgi:hypothetical protein